MLPSNAETTSQQDDGQNTPDELGIIQLPEGLTADWLIQKTKHLNSGFKEWFSKNLGHIEDNYKLYELKPVSGQLPNGTNIPIVTSIVDTMTSRAVSSLVPREKFVDAVALDPELVAAGDYNKQNMISDFINETITNTEEFQDKVDEAIKTLFLENVTLVETRWAIDTHEEMQSVKSIDPLTGQEVETELQTVKTEVGHPDFEPISIRMCAWDPRCKTEFAESPWFRIRSMRSINELFQLQQDGVIQNVDDVVKKTSKTIMPDSPSDPDAKQSQAVDGKQLPSIGWDDGVWEVDKWYATLAWKKEDGTYMQGEYEFWIVGGDTVVKFRDNVFIPQRKPLITIKSSRKPGQLLAQGPVDVIKDMQKDLNTNMANLGQLLKNAAYSPTFYEPSSGMDGRRVSLQSNSLIPVLNIKGIQRFEPAVHAISEVQQYIGFLINEMRQATAANDQAQGIGGSQTDTATEAQILAQGSNTRFGYIIEMINNSFFGALAAEYFKLWKQFGAPGQMMVKDGSSDGKGYAVQPADLQGHYVFRSVPTQSQQAKLQHFGQLKSLMTDLLQLQMQAPQMLVDNTGKQKQLDVYDFLTNQMLPLVGVQGRGLFKDAPPPPPMPPMGLPGPGGPGAPGGPPTGPMPPIGGPGAPGGEPQGPPPPPPMPVGAP